MPEGSSGGPGERGKNLEPDQVRAIAECIAAGERHTVIAERFGVSAQTVRAIKSGKRWASAIDDELRERMAGSSTARTLTPVAARQVMAALEAGRSGRSIAEQFGISPEHGQRDQARQGLVGARPRLARASRRGAATGQGTHCRTGRRDKAAPARGRVFSEDSGGVRRLGLDNPGDLTGQNLDRGRAEAGQTARGAGGWQGAFAGCTSRRIVASIDGIVITTAAFRAFVAETDCGTDSAQFHAQSTGRHARRGVVGRLNAHQFDVSGAVVATALREELAHRIARIVSIGSLVVRSCHHRRTPMSVLCGLHDSLIGVEGLDAALAAVATVWCRCIPSVRSCTAPNSGWTWHAAMAVVVQQLATSERIVITFTVSRRTECRRDRGVIEASEGIVSGRVESDHWTMDRRSGSISAYTSGSRDQTMTLIDARVELEAISDRRGLSASLEGDLCRRV